MFSVSRAVDGATYTISGNTPSELFDNYALVEGPDGLAARIDALAHEVAAEAVKPIAATVEPVAKNETTPTLTDLVLGAPDRKTLTALWKAHKADWSSEVNKVAVDRGKQIDKETKP